MKFCFVVTNLAGGGAENVVLKICAGLDGRGHEVQLILLEHIVEHPIPSGIATQAMTAPGEPISKGVIGKRFAAIRLRKLIRDLVAERPHDLLVSTLPFADEVAILARLPRHWCRIANTLSAEIARLRASAPRKAARRLARYRRLYGRRPLIAVSDGVARDLRASLGLSGTRIERIYNPFDFAAMRAQAAAPAPLPRRPYVIHVGRFAPQKRHDLLLEAWAQTDVPHKLVLLTEPIPALQALIDARGLKQRVIVAGFQSNPYPWMAGADLLVLCSDHEGLPGVIIEALAVGTPVVSTDCPSGPREILGEAFTACLVPMGDAAALAAAVTAALTDPPDTARADLTRFDINFVLPAYERLAQQLEPKANVRR